MRLENVKRLLQPWTDVAPKKWDLADVNCPNSLLSPHVHNLVRSHVDANHLLLSAAAQVVLASDVPQDRIRPGQFHLKINSFQYVADMRQAL